MRDLLHYKLTKNIVKNIMGSRILMLLEHISERRKNN